MSQLVLSTDTRPIVTAEQIIDSGKLHVTITRTKQENPTVTTLFFKRPFTFTAGQYISAYFDDTDTPEGKAYSLSSRPNEAEASITVKNIHGVFSSRLCALKKGDTLTISRPYGHFNPQVDRPLVGIVGGVGISPVWSVLSHSLESGNQHDTHLFYSNKTKQDIVFEHKLAELSSVHPQFHVRHHITRESTASKEHISGRIDIPHLLKEVSAEAHFLICGRLDFVRSMWRDLTQLGIGDKMISTETFFEQ